MINQKQHNNYLLMVTGIGISVLVLYSLVKPTAGNRSISSFVFPERIPLKSWQQKASNSLNQPSKPQINEENEEIVKSGQSYSYSKNKTDLTIEMRYIVGTRGNLDEYFDKYSSIAVNDIETKKIEQIENIGFYTLFTDDGRLYLSSCINPQGNSSVTREHFFHNLNSIEWGATLWHWFLGKASIRDYRCLWTHLSTTIDQTQPQLAHQILKQAWTDWYLWWKPRFPRL